VFCFGRRPPGNVVRPTGSARISRSARERKQHRSARAQTRAQGRRRMRNAARPTPRTIGLTGNGRKSTRSSTIRPGSCARSRRSSTPSRSARSRRRRACPSQPARGFGREYESHIRGIGRRYLRLSREARGPKVKQRHSSRPVNFEIDTMQHSTWHR
jgi:hypothetical protein